VHSRSPLLILVEGICKRILFSPIIALWFDALINLIIMTQGMSDQAMCVLGIITSVTFHYFALVSIVLRAYRIRRFFDVYNEYFRRQEEL
jgi:hypothetical protein